MAKYRPKAISFDAEFDRRKNLWWVDWPVCRWFSSKEFERLYEPVEEQPSPGCGCGHKDCIACLQDWAGRS